MKKISTQGWRYSRAGPISRVLQLEKYDLVAKSQDVVVKVTAAPLHRTDTAIINGTALGRDKTGLAAFPRVGGCEGVGVVVSSGASKTVKEGDTVWVAPLNGMWAETIVVDAAAVHKIDPKFAATFAPFASNFILAQRLLTGYGRVSPTADVIVQNGGACLTSIAVSAFGKAQQKTVVTVASPGSRFSAAAARHKAFGSEVYEYNGKGARAVKKALGGKNVALYLNGVGGRSFNEFLKLVGTNGSVVSYGAQNSFGLMWSGSHQIYKQVSMQGLYLPQYLRSLTYEQRQMQLDFALNAAAEAKLQYPTEKCSALAELPTTWDKVFVSGASKGLLTLKK